MAKARNNTIQIDREPQWSLFPALPAVATPTPVSRPEQSTVFLGPDPRTIFLGNTRLDQFLQQRGMTEAFIVRSLMEKLDWAPFEAKYKAGGRPPYAPQAMAGIILFGTMRGLCSLRELERLARTDLECMWVSGGIAPDHSALGRFVNTHQGELTLQLFEGLTREALKATKSGTHSVAGDGTVIQAAASRYKMIKREAALQAAAEASQQAQADPHNEAAQQAAAQTQEVANTLEQRAKAREAKGKGADYLRISPTEPEAMVQPQKDKTMAPSYKPSVLANEKRVIVATSVDPSNETKVVAQMLEQADQIGDEQVREAMFDASYITHDVIALAVQREIDLLCPEGNVSEELTSWEKQARKKFPKSAFVYDEGDDTYTCPAGQKLIQRERYRGTEQTPGYVGYGTQACASCPMRDKCTTGQDGRKVRRYAGDELKDALRQVMAQSKARRRYLQRQAMVEPVYGELRGIQGLRRFHRRGLKGVTVEFVLHAMAHNLRRVVAVFAALVLLWIRSQAQCWMQRLQPEKKEPSSLPFPRQIWAGEGSMC